MKKEVADLVPVGWLKLLYFIVFSGIMKEYVTVHTVSP